MLTAKAKEALSEDIGALMGKIQRNDYTYREIALLILSELQTVVNTIEVKEE